VPALPRTRQLQDTEAYSKLYYASKLKSIVDAEVSRMSLIPGENKKFAKIREVTKREWANESDEVKEQVRAKKEEPRNLKLTEGTTPSPEQYQESIDDLSFVGNTFLDHI
jgi:hypothetical protein